MPSLLKNQMDNLHNIHGRLLNLQEGFTGVGFALTDTNTSDDGERLGYAVVSMAESLKEQTKQMEEHLSLIRGELDTQV